MYKIALIKPNNLTITDPHTNPINNFIELIDVGFQNMMEIIVDKIDLKNDGIGETVICHEDADNIYQLCYLDPKPNNKEESENTFNAIASYLVRKDVHGPAVLINSHIMENGICGTDTLSMHDIIDLLFKKMNHIGIKLRCDGEIEEFTFTDLPLTEEELEQYLVMEHHILKFNLLIYVKKRPLNTINKNATKLLGTGKLADDVFIVAKITETEYINLTLEIMDQLLVICEGPVPSRQLTAQEIKTNEKINDLPVIKNAHYILKKRYNAHEKRCNKCGILINTGVKICGGCYRMIYCSQECQKNDWPQHKKNCLHKQEPINKNI